MVTINYVNFCPGHQKKVLDKTKKIVYNKEKKKRKFIYMIIIETNAIYFDMDGTIANFYGVPNWLAHLEAKHTLPYRVAKPLVDMRELGRTLNKLQAKGFHIGIVSWLSKNGTKEYNSRVTKAKEKWLASHMGSVHFDEIKIVPYGTPKQEIVDFPSGILFDDEVQNRKNWVGNAYDVNNILEVLKQLV